MQFLRDPYYTIGAGNGESRVAGRRSVQSRFPDFRSPTTYLPSWYDFTPLLDVNSHVAIPDPVAGRRIAARLCAPAVRHPGGVVSVQSCRFLSVPGGNDRHTAAPRRRTASVQAGRQERRPILFP